MKVTVVFVEEDRGIVSTEFEGLMGLDNIIYVYDAHIDAENLYLGEEESKALGLIVGEVGRINRGI